MAPFGALLLGWACAPALEPVGMSTGSAPTAPASSPSPKATVWAFASSLKGWTRANAKRFPSTGHWFGKYDADVLVNDEAKVAYASVGPGVSASVGARIAKVHITRDGVNGPILAMEKDASGWLYIEMDSTMHVLRRGRLSPCIECHGHVAGQDELFGVPLTGK